MQSDTARLQELLRYIVAQGWYPSVARLDHFCRWYFAEVSLEGSTVLDVGCGRGMLAACARLRGASQCVGIEPEADGSGTGSLNEFRRMIDELSLDGIEARCQRLEDVIAADETYDVVSMCNVINHLDEAQVTRVHKCPTARQRYCQILRSIRALLRPGGGLIITDCGRRNLFAPLTRLGIRHPFEPTIDWSHHQEPSTWSRLLADAGFSPTHIRWRVPNPFRALSPLLANGLAARCISSEFRILARR